MSEDPPIKITPTIYPKRSARRAGKLPKSQKDRTAQHAAALRRINIHRPLGNPTAQDVKTMKDLKDMLRQTWHRLMDKVDKFQRFTPKQIRFAQEYALSGRSNIIGSMRKAGYESSTPHVLFTMGKKNMRHAHFEDLVQAFELEAKARMKMNVQDVVEYFSKIADAAMGSGDFTNANRAMENLAKYLQMFVEKREITHRVVHSREELDARIKELTQIVIDVEPEIEDRLRIA